MASPKKKPARQSTAKPAASKPTASKPTAPKSAALKSAALKSAAPQSAAPQSAASKRDDFDDAADAVTPFLAAAAALAPKEVQRFGYDPELAFDNVRIGAAAVLGEGARLAKLPETDIDELRSMPELAAAVRQAASRVDRASGSNARALLAQATPVRRRLLKVLDALAESGLLPGAAVAKILSGGGPIDVANDLVDAAALLRKSPGVLARSPLNKADVEAAATLGAELTRALRPKGAVKVTPAALKQSLDLRDRLGTLLTRRHEALWRAGAYLFGRHEVDARVPLLGSRARAAKKTPKVVAPVDPQPNG